MLATIPVSPLPNAVVSKGCKSTFEPGQGESDFSSTFAAVADHKRNMEDVADGTNAPKAGWNRKGKPSNDVNPKDQAERDASEGEESKEAAKDLEEGTESPPMEEDPQQTATTDFATGIVGGQTVNPDVHGAQNPGNETDSSKLPDGSAGSKGPNPLINKTDETLPLNGIETERSESAGIEKVISEGKEPGGIIDTAKTVIENGKIVSAEAKTGSSETKTSTGESTGEPVVSTTRVSSQPNGTGDEGRLVESAVREVENGSVSTSNAAISVGEGEEKIGKAEVEAARRGINHLDGLTAETPSKMKSHSDMGKGKADPVLFRDADSSWVERSKKDDLFLDGKGIAKAADGSKGLERSTDVIGKDRSEMTLVSQRQQKVNISSVQKQGPSREGMYANVLAEKSMDPSQKVTASKDHVPVSNLRSVSENISSEARTAEKNDGSQKDSSAKTGETSGKVMDIRDVESQSRNSGSENQDRQRDDKKQHHSQGKESQGVLEKSEAAKGVDTPLMPKAKYGADNVTNTVVQETDKEIQKSSGGKEGLGSLVRTAAFLLKNGRSEVKMALHPESLGHLRINISTESQHVTVKIMAETVAAKELIENNLHQLKVDFQNQGLEIQKFDVSLSQDANKNGAGHNSAFENRARGRSGAKKNEKTGQDESLEQTVTHFSRTGHNTAVDFFA